MSTRIKKMLATVACAVTAVTGATVAAPAATAQPKQVVFFGDSLMANPIFQFVEVTRGAERTSGNAPSQGRCPKGQARLATSLERLGNVNVEDFSCTGATAYAPERGQKRLSGQVSAALSQRQLNANTSTVMIQMGLNDTWKAPGLYEQQAASYVNEMRAQVARIRTAAPNAQIKFVSYPSMVGRNGEFCIGNVNGSSSGALPVFPVRSAFDAVHDWQRRSARAVGGQWVNLEAPTRGHDSCAPESRRWVAGIFDYGTKDYNITTHLTHDGNDGVARALLPYI